MNPKDMMWRMCCGCYQEKREETMEELQQTFDNIKRDIDSVGKMNLSNQSMAICKKELYSRLNEIKSKMHKLIDRM